MPNPLVIAINVDVLDANGKITSLNRALGGIGDSTEKATRQASRGLSDLERSAASAAITIKNQFTDLGSLIKGVFGIGLAQAAKSAVDVAASFELAELGIEAFVKEGEDAKQVFNDLKAFSLKSPLEFTTILEASNQLLALKTQTKELIPTLKALSIAMYATTGGKDVPDRLKDVIRALGQVRAAGALTGEEFRQIKNANIVNIDELAKAFGVSIDVFEKAIADRAVPAGAVLKAIIQSAEDRFSKFGDRVERSARVAFSNFKDALAQAADAALKNYIPRLVDGIDSLSEKVRALGDAVAKYQPEIEYGFKILGSAVLVGGVYKLVTALVELRLGWTALNGVIAANPIGAALVAASVGIAAFEYYGDYLQSAEVAQIKLNLELLKTNRVLGLIKQGKSNEDFLKMGISAKELAEAYKRLNEQGYNFQKRLKELPADAERFAAENSPEREQFRLDYSRKLAEQAEARRKAAIKDSQNYLDASRRKELDGLAQVREAYEQQLRDVSGFKEAEKNVEIGFTNFLAAERDKQFADIQRRLDDNLTAYKKFYLDRKKEEFRYADETREILERTQLAELSEQVRGAGRVRDSQIRAVESLAAYTVEQKVAVEQETARIEIEFQRQSLSLRQQLLDKELRNELDRAKRQSFDSLQIEIDKVQEIEKQHLASLELRATTQALAEAKGGKLSTEQEIALQEKLSAIRLAFATYSANQESSIRAAEAAKLNSRLAAIELEYGRKSVDLKAEVEDAVTKARENAVVRSSQIVQSNNLRVFEGLKRNVEGLFDAVVTRSKSFGEDIADAIKLPILAAFKEIVSTRIAAFLFEIFGGGKVGIGQGGQPSFSGGGLSVNTRGSNILGRLLGLGGAGALGFGGIPGAPGGTSGFSGPVQSIPGLVGVGTQGGELVIPGLGGVGGVGSASGAKGIGASLSGAAGSLKGILASLGNLGRGGAVLGPGSNGGALAQSGVGGVAGGAMLLGGGLLGFLGLRRGGVSGLGLSIAGGALAGAKFGVAGALIGAGIGAVAGTIRLFVKGAEEKIVEKVKAAYGITISKSFARDPLLGIIKQTFGGDINVGIQSQQVRDLIELYAMSTGQSIGSLPRVKPISSGFSLSGGGLSQLPSYSNGQPLSLGQLPGASNPTPQPVVVQLDPDSTTAFLQGQAVESINNNPRVVQGAVISASRQNAGRRQSLALAINPGVLL